MANLTLQGIKSMGDVITAYDWNLSITKSPNSIPGIDSDTLNMRCMTIDIPKYTNQNIEIKLRGMLTVNQPGSYMTSGTITAQFYSTEDMMIVKNVINDWQKAIFDPETGVAGKKSDIEGQFRITQNNRQKQELYAYDLFGVFYEDVEPGQYQNEGTVVLQPTLTFRYDYFTMEVINSSTNSYTANTATTV